MFRQIGEQECSARDELNKVKDSIGCAKQQLESDVLAESLQIAHLKVSYTKSTQPSLIKLSDVLKGASLSILKRNRCLKKGLKFLSYLTTNRWISLIFVLAAKSRTDKHSHLVQFMYEWQIIKCVCVRGGGDFKKQERIAKSLFSRI